MHSPARHMLSDAYGQWRRICPFQPASLTAWRALENALDCTLFNYSEQAK